MSQTTDSVTPQATDSLLQALDMQPNPSLEFSIVGIVLPLLILAGGVGGFFALGSLRKSPVSTQPEQKIALVQTVAVQVGESGFRMESDGEVVPFRQVILAAEVAGRVLSKSQQCRAGRYVKQGTLLLQIDPRDYDLETQLLQQSARQANVAIEELDVERSNNEALIELTNEELKLQQDNLARILGLRKKNSASLADVDLARRDELRARNSLQTLANQQLLLAARRGRLLRDKDRIAIELEKAGLDRQRTEIRAPMDGIVMEDLVEQDGYVQRGAELVRMEDVSKMEVRFQLRMKELQWLWQTPSGESAAFDLLRGNSFELPDTPVNVSLSLDGRSFTWEGRLSRYDGAGINAATRTIPCIAVVDEPSKVRASGDPDQITTLPAPPTLMRGMFVNVSIPIETTTPLLKIPQVSLQPGNELWLVRGGKLHLAHGRVVHSGRDDALLLCEDASISPGEEVVVSPLPVAFEGMEVRTPASETGRVSETPSPSEGVRR